MLSKVKFHITKRRIIMYIGSLKKEENFGRWITSLLNLEEWTCVKATYQEKKDRVIITRKTNE